MLGYILILFFIIVGIVVNYKIYIKLPKEVTYSFLGTAHIIMGLGTLAILFLMYVFMIKNLESTDKILKAEKYELVQEPLYKLKNK